MEKQSTHLVCPPISRAPLYSLVIPIKNEEANIEPLVEEIETAMKGFEPWELICIDDGSTDGSRELLKKLTSTKPYLRLILFSQNFGQSAAFAAGFQAARGTFVITLDGDGQNDPADIPRLIQTVENYDLVVGWRLHRKDNWQKRCISKFSNYIRARLCHDGMHDSGCSLKIYRKEALDTIPRFSGMHRFLPALFILGGYRVTEMAVSHRPRTRGKTKYHLFNRLTGPILDLFFVMWMHRKKLTYTIENYENSSSRR